MANDNGRIEGRELNQTYELHADIVGEPKIASLQCDFPLCEADYLRLTTGSSRFARARIALLYLSLGYGIPFAAKLVSKWWSDASTNIEPWELWSLVISIVLFFVCALVAISILDEKRILLRTMKEHFERNPRQRAIVRPIDE